MATRKRSDWLDDPESEDDERGYDSDLADQGRDKAIASRKTKRRRIDPSHTTEAISEDEEEPALSVEEEDDNISQEEDNLSHDPSVSKSDQNLQELEPMQDADEVGSDDVHDDEESKRKSSLAKQLAKSAKTSKKSGVVYLSRVPPFMKPHTVKHFLSPYAPSGLGRIFLSPESADARRSRLKAGGNRKRNFTDGWIEFASKREAKIAVETLNTRTIGGKKGGYYRDDVWNLKYLRGFKWRHLTEQIANENAERASRLRAEDAKERREVREYLRNVEFAKMMDGMQKKRKMRAERVGAGGPDAEVEEAKATDRRGLEHRMQFRQAEVKAKANGAGGDAPAEVKRTLGRIF